MFRSPMTLSGPQRTLTLVVLAIVTMASLVTLTIRTRPASFALTLLVFALLLAWAMSPRALVVDSGELRVERRAWRPLTFPLSTVASASVLDTPRWGALRVFGVGGFFGSFGLFSSRALGRFRLYATRSGQALLVQRVGGKLPVVLTPDDVAGALEALRRASGQAHC